MKKLNIIIILLLSIVGLSSCSDYLDRKNLDSFDDENFWTSEQNMRTFAQGTYTAYFVGYANAWAWGNFFTSAPFADDYYNSSVWGTTTATSGNGWSFTYVRRHNLMINRVDRMPVSEDAKNHWRGIGRFFRAQEYTDLVWAFGDVPYTDKEVFPNDSKDILYQPRDPKALVCTKIMEDYEYAALNVRTDDGANQVNRYVVLGMMSRNLLKLGTMLKYHNDDPEVAKKLIEKSKWASEQIMSSGKFQIIDDFKSLFTSDDLSGNKEVIFFRAYVTGKVTHSLITYSCGVAEGQQGITLRALNTFLSEDGLPVKQSPLYNYSNDQNIRLYTDMYKNRDPRLYVTLNDTLRVNGVDNAAALTGICVSKFTPYSFSTPDNYTSDKNITDSPILRYGEILLNYAEAAAELGVFDQTAADNSINLLRARKIKKDPKGDEIYPQLPKMVISGTNVTANGVVINDPDRDPDVSPILWEIRRERSIELMMEGFRRSDLKRWKKYSYLINREIDNLPNDAVVGAYFDFTKYTAKEKKLIRDKVSPVALYCPIPGDSTRIALNPIKTVVNRRDWVDGDIIYERQYFTSVPKDQIKLYKDNGVDLTQNPGWEKE